MAAPLPTRLFLKAVDKMADWLNGMNEGKQVFKFQVLWVKCKLTVKWKVLNEKDRSAQQCNESNVIENKN